MNNSSKNKLLFNVIIIYGTVAVGKFTVANELHKLINYKFFHNHHTYDLSRQLFERGSLYGGRIIENIRIMLIKEIAEAKINVITTHTYSPKFVSTTGLSDPMYMKKVQSIIERKGGRACFVHLFADEKEILKRVSGESRKNHMKLKDKKIMKEILKTDDWELPAPVKNNLQIDSTNLSAKQVSNFIIKHFNLS